MVATIFSSTSGRMARTMSRHGEAVDARLRRGIVRLAELALLPVHRADVDDAAPLTLDHALDDLLGHIEETVQVGVDDRAPIIRAHFAEQAIARDARVVDQHIDRAQVGGDPFKGRYRRIPVRHVAYRCIERVALRCLLIQPLLVIAAWAATCHHAKAILGQALANRGADTAHPACYVSQFSAHWTSSCVRRTPR
ncbi:hypothetical protein G6F22_018809 [Rhizopus arrhizus]|nr:hypothetical protein G6F22_018809 [Rhizopus arrhizus]